MLLRDSLLISLLVFGSGIGLAGCSQAQSPAESASVAVRPPSPSPKSDSQVGGNAASDQKFNGDRAYDYLKEICELGSRRSGSRGMRAQQKMLEAHFTELGAEVGYQRFVARHPETGKRVPMANMVIAWHPESEERILLCAHYDTRPYADNEIDPRRRRNGVFLGANDGASGVALLMELANHVPEMQLELGLDFVLFDAEEFVFVEGRDPYFLGSRWFARQYLKNADHRYVAGVLFDMVADAELSVYQERYSATWSDTRPIVKEIWSTAERLGVEEFIPRIKYEVLDDHLPLHQIGKIPVVDVIDFEYPDSRNRYWHTLNDAPGRCSADSLGKVGWVIEEWLSGK